MTINVAIIGNAVLRFAFEKFISDFDVNHIVKLYESYVYVVL